MKYMRGFDFLIQTATLLATLVLVFMAWEDRDMWLFVMVLQFVIGTWQYVSGAIWLMAYPKVRSRRIHMMLATIYLIILFTTAMINHVDGNKFYAVYVFGLPWLLAMYYYLISWRTVFPKAGRLSKFLPHVSF